MDAVSCTTCGSSLDFLLGGDETIFYCPTCKEVELRITNVPEGGVADSGGEPITGEPLVDKPAVGQPAIGKPSVEGQLVEPFVEESIVGEAVVEEPVVEEPVVEGQVEEDARFICSECGRELGILREGNAHIYYCGPCRRVDMEVDVVEDYLNRVHPEDEIMEDDGDDIDFGT